MREWPIPGFQIPGFQRTNRVSEVWNLESGIWNRPTPGSEQPGGEDGEVVGQGGGAAKLVEVGAEGTDHLGRGETGQGLVAVGQGLGAKLIAVGSLGLDQAVGVEQEAGVGVEGPLAAEEGGAER